MITLDKIRIYAKYGGDVDAWVRANAAEERSALTEAEWRLIENLVQDLAVVDSGRASPAYAQRVDRRLLEDVDGDGAAAELRKLA